MFSFRSPSQEDYLSDPDVQLMLKFQSGDPSAFEDLMRRHFKSLMNFLYKMHPDRTLAEELAQETFLKIFEQAGSYRPQSRFRTWAYTIARRLCLNELRKASRSHRSLDEMNDEDSSLHDRLAAEAPNARDVLSQEDLTVAVRAALDRLPPQQKMAVVLRRYDGFSYEEIARIMGTSSEAVKSLLNRAKEALRKDLSRQVSLFGGKGLSS